MDSLRKDLKQYMTDNQRCGAWVAKQIQVSRNMMSLYLRGERNLSEHNCVKIIKLIKEI